MDLVNETSLQSHLARAQLVYRDLLQAIVVVKGSFDVLPSGETRPSAEQRPILLEDEETPFGGFDAEIVPVKAWCAVALIGHAWSPPPGEPAARSLVTLRIGRDFVRQARVSGDRVWVRAVRKLVASDPVPFRKLPLDYA